MRLLFFLVFITVDAFAAEQIIIGCATRCDSFFQRAFHIVGKKNNVNIKVIDLSKSKISISEVHGVVLPGGADIDPKYYLDEIDEELRSYTLSLNHLVKYSEEGRVRDPIEFNLLKKYFEDEDTVDLPLLGVCRGMQMIAVSQGIPLYVDIKHEMGIRNRRYLFDKILIKNLPSIMKEIFARTSFWGFKRHHQGVRVEYFFKNKSKWPDISLTSFSNKGLIAESIEFKNRPVLGVQFHPENDFGYERMKIFSWLIAKAKERKESRIHR